LRCDVRIIILLNVMMECEYLISENAYATY